MWDFAAYVLSEDQNIANNVAHSYLALTLGEESYMSKSAINLWRGNVEDAISKAGKSSSYDCDDDDEEDDEPYYETPPTRVKEPTWFDQKRAERERKLAEKERIRQENIKKTTETEGFL